jgi:hypothetical protein
LSKVSESPWTFDDRLTRVYDAGGECVADVWNPNNNDGPMISAAPEMFEALEQALSALNSMSGLVKKPHAGGPEDRVLEKTRDAIRAALAKAVGV